MIGELSGGQSVQDPFDLDGVLADMESELVRQAEVLFGEPMTRRLQERASESGAPAAAADDRPASTAPERQAAADGAPDNAPALLHLNMTSRQQRRLWRHVESIENFWESLAEIEPGAVQRLATVTHERRWEVLFLTKRPETVGAIAQVQSPRWLEARDFTLPSVYASRARADASPPRSASTSRRRPSRELPRRVVDSKARAMLVWREDETQLPAAAKRLGIGVVKSVGDCLDILTQVDSAEAHEQPGVMNRVMRLLGLAKEPATT